MSALHGGQGPQYPLSRLKQTFPLYLVSSYSFIPIYLLGSNSALYIWWSPFYLYIFWAPFLIFVFRWPLFLPIYLRFFYLDNYIWGSPVLAFIWSLTLGGEGLITKLLKIYRNLNRNPSVCLHKSPAIDVDRPNSHLLAQKGFSIEALVDLMIFPIRASEDPYSAKNGISYSSFNLIVQLLEGNLV